MTDTGEGFILLTELERQTLRIYLTEEQLASVERLPASEAIDTLGRQAVNVTMPNAFPYMLYLLAMAGIFLGMPKFLDEAITPYHVMALLFAALTGLYRLSEEYTFVKLRIMRVSAAGYYYRYLYRDRAIALVTRRVDAVSATNNELRTTNLGLIEHAADLSRQLQEYQSCYAHPRTLQRLEGNTAPANG
jgi:hypothetical protein